MVTFKSFTSYFLNPSRSTLSEYWPTGSVVNSKLPSGFVTANRVTAVASCQTLTLACATTAPEGSVTVPRTVPVVCASTILMGSNDAKNKMHAFHLKFSDMCFSPPQFLNAIQLFEFI